MNLLPRDLEMFSYLGISPTLLEESGIARVTNDEARELLGPCRSGDMSGILFPYFQPATMNNGRVRCYLRIRRDNPEIENGKASRKYIAPYADRKRLFFPPRYDLFADVQVPIILVESEKAALALIAWAERIGRRILPLAMGGCWGWKGKIGIKTLANGERVPENGPIPDLGICRDGRLTYVMLDANCATNPKISAARRSLVQVLKKHGAVTRIIDLPQSSDVNGPDDYIGIHGDQAMAQLLDRPETEQERAANVDDWKKLLIRPESKDGPGTALPVLANVLVALRYAREWSGVLAYNSFAHRIEIQSETPWNKSAGTLWDDADDGLACEWMQRNWIVIKSSKTTNEAANIVARENSFNPLQDYLNGLDWDGFARLDEWLIRYAGVKDSPYARAVGRRWMISAVARALRPGCKADAVLVFVGPQGAMKSTMLRLLAGSEYFTDHVAELGSKDSRINLAGIWLVEFSEMDKIKGKRDLEPIKAFVSCPIDKFRLPFERRNSEHPRTCVFAGTCNGKLQLVDETGNRRWWPVECGRID